MAHDDPYDARESGYQEGHASVYRSLLKLCLRELRGVTPLDPVLHAAGILLERAETIALLRRLCREHGDNEWPDDLHLRDIIEKHLYFEKDNHADNKNDDHF